MNEGCYTLGVDPAKRKFTACLLAERREVMAPRDFECSEQGFKDLEHRLDKVLASKETCLVVGVEASASYDDNLLAFFRQLGLRRAVALLRVDSAQVKHFSGARPVRAKTDAADARRVAQFTRQYADELDRFETDPQAQSVQRVVNERFALVRDLVALRNALRERLVAAFPEFEKVFRDPTTPLALTVLKHAPTAAVASRKRASTLSGLQAAKGGEYLGLDRAQELVKLAKTSIASATGEGEQNAVRRTIERIELLREHIAEVEAEMQAYVDQADSKLPEPDQPLSLPQEIRLVDSIPGIAVVGASAIVMRARGISRFVDAKALAAQMGTCPQRSQTGSSRDSAKLTSRGDRLVRAMLYQLTLVATLHDPAMAFHRWHAEKKGLLGKRATCACMNRMSHIIFGVVKNRRSYDLTHVVENIRRHHTALWKEFLQDHPNWVKRLEKIHPEGLT
jgi:transposase